MSTYAVPRDLTGFESMKAFQQYEAHGVTGLFCGAADVRSKKHILQCTVPRGYLRFTIENIEAGGEYPLRDQRFDQSIVVDHFSASNVHHNRMERQQLDTPAVKKSGKLRGTRRSNQENVAHREQALRGVVIHGALLQLSRQRLPVVIMHTYPEASGPIGDSLPDPAHPENTQAAANQADAQQLRGRPTWPLAGSHQHFSFVGAAGGVEDEEHRDLSTSIGEDTGRVEDCYLVGPRCIDVNVIETNGKRSHSFQSSCERLKHQARNLLGCGDEQIITVQGGAC